MTGISRALVAALLGSGFGGIASNLVNRRYASGGGMARRRAVR